MPPKKEDTLVGRSVLAPASLWPDFPLPRGKKGWAGVVGKKKDAQHHFVTFPESGDSTKYFFSDKDISSWLVEEEKEAAPAPTPAAPGSSRKPAASGGSAAKRKEAAQQKEQQQEEGRASKKGKAAAAGEDPQAMSREALKQAILSNLEGLDTEQLRSVYTATLEVKLGKR